MISSAKTDSSGLPYLDAAEGLGRIGKNKALFSRLLDTFVKDSNWQKLCDFVDQNNLADAALAAHAIKGMCANLSMKALYAVVADLETALKAGTNDAALLEQVRQSREETLATIALVKAELA